MRARRPSINTPSSIEQLSAAFDGAIVGFCAESGWEGDFYSLARFWVAPPTWNYYDCGEEAMAAKFVFAVAEPSGDGDDRDEQLAYSALIGAGDHDAALCWRREVAGSGITFSKFVGKQREMRARLEAMGFERNRRFGDGFHLPLTVSAEALRRGDLKEAVRPLAVALYKARVAAPLFKPLVEWNRDELSK